MYNTNKRYNEEFKKQIVKLINSGKNINEVVKEYNIARPTVNKWVKDYSSFGSFKLNKKMIYTNENACSEIANDL